jgi:hypothetical protein
VELTETEIIMLRGLEAKPILDIPGGIVVDNLYSYEITDDGRAALKRSDGG